MLCFGKTASSRGGCPLQILYCPQAVSKVILIFMTSLYRLFKLFFSPVESKVGPHLTGWWYLILAEVLRDNVINVFHASGSLFPDLLFPGCDSYTMEFLTVPAGSRIPWYTKDRKSTRLNSSHQIISYAVFCLKKKKKKSLLSLILQQTT